MTHKNHLLIAGNNRFYVKGRSVLSGEFILYRINTPLKKPAPPRVIQVVKKKAGYRYSSYLIKTPFLLITGTSVQFSLRMVSGKKMNFLSNIFLFW